MWQSEGGAIEMELVKVNGIGKVYRKKTVLHDVNFAIEQGEIYGLVGNNGAGKTTLLRIIGNMLRPTSGKIVLNKEQFKSKVRIGVLIERPAYYFDMSAYENIKAKALALGVRYAPQDINDLLELRALLSFPAGDADLIEDLQNNDAVLVCILFEEFCLGIR